MIKYIPCLESCIAIALSNWNQDRQANCQRRNCVPLVSSLIIKDLQFWSWSFLLWSQGTKRRSRHDPFSIVHEFALTDGKCGLPLQATSSVDVFVWAGGSTLFIPDFPFSHANLVVDGSWLPAAGLWKQSARMSVLPPPLAGLLDQHVENVALITFFLSPVKGVLKHVVVLECSNEEHKGQIMTIHDNSWQFHECRAMIKDILRI